jgi:Fe-Mn family superoxide dismutase
MAPQPRPALPSLPYSESALEPCLSRQNLHAHYDGFLRRVVVQLEELLRNTAFADQPLEALVQAAAPRAIRDAATQVYNHELLWNSLRPPPAAERLNEPSPDVARLLTARFASLDAFREQFERRARSIVGSGWIWLVLDPNANATILVLGNAGNPLSLGYEPLLGCDLWEHAYYMDYGSDRGAYLQAWWSLVNWDFVASRLAQARRRLGQALDDD